MRNKQKQVEGSKNLKPKEQTKVTQGKSNNQSVAKNIFDDLVKERMNTINKLHESVEYNNLKFEYAGLTKSVSFYEFMDSKELFNKIKSNQIKFNDAQKNKNSF